ncbi:MAG: hypothetical protein HOC71_09535 [Candidatus Latescibacteria bacterium]|jgi:hypothetical protein|nr:hypothetical protein [Candidatus Latescibacterota bacterium]
MSTGFKLDERNSAVIGKICTILYAFTIYFLIGDVLYREFALHQSPKQFHDIAALITGNVLVFITLLLYYGGVNVGKISFRYVVVGYVLFVSLGMAFTVFKYRLNNLSAILDKAVIVVTICSIMVIVAVTVAYIGRRRIDRQIE